MSEARYIQQDTIDKLTIAINGEVPLEALLQILDKDKFFGKATYQAKIGFITRLLEKLNES